jgi:hypothetical protein
MGTINGVTAHETTVGECRQYVERRVPFHTTNKQLFGYWCTSGVYAVFSYGQHWPLFVYEPTTSRWFANEDKYGTTTSKHYGKAHPFHVTPIHLSCTAMKKLVAAGYTALAEWRITDNDMEQRAELLAGLRGEAA